MGECCGEAGGLEEAGLLVASGGAERNPRWCDGESVGLEEVAMPVAAYGIDASSRLFLCVGPYRGFRYAPPAVTNSPAPLGPLVLHLNTITAGPSGR